MTTIKFRRGTTAQWEAADPILAEGEPGLDLDTGILKIGDGTTRWSVIASYFQPGVGSGDVVGPASATDNTLPRFDSATGKLLKGSGIVVGDDNEMLFPAGSTSHAPIKFSSGTNLSSPEAGAIEYDGTVFYSTPIVNQRGLTPSTMFAIVPAGGFALSTASGVQSCFPATNDTWTLSASTTYYVSGFYSIQKSTNAVTTAIAFDLGGGASITSMRLAVQTSHGAANATSTANNSTTVTQVASTVVTASNANNVLIRFDGLIRMNAGGTITPQINFSATAAGTPTMLADSYIMFTPMGTNTVESVGNVA